MLMSLFMLTINAQEKSGTKWQKIIDAISQVESRGNAKAYNPNGDCVGLLQITQTCVKEANAILKQKGIDNRFSLDDRWDAEKSKEMFILIQEKYNLEGDLVKACRVWNEGPNYNKKIKTTSYVKKVMSVMK